MRWLGDRESENVEDERGGGGGGFGIPVAATGGFGAIVVVLIGLFLGVDPSMLMSIINGDNPPQQGQVQTRPDDGRGYGPGYGPGYGQGYGPGNGQANGQGNGQADRQGYGSSRPPQSANGEDPMKHFVSVVLADTEDVWRQVFQDMGKRYDDPKLVLYTGAVRSPCGLASTAAGPFYCPNDQKAYLDLAFFEDLRNRFHASGEFAEAYVIAHEIGHHVQNELGILGRAQAERQRSDPQHSNQISVRIELQADCIAGVWANHADRTKHILERGDIESALNAASAVGDDRLQQQARGYVVPDSFTHGTSAQRVRWFKRGLGSGNLRDCDTFSAAQL